MARIFGYKETLNWLLDNDDTEWLDDENGSPSVTLSLVADIFGKTTEQATKDLLKRRSLQYGQCDSGNDH